MDTRYEVGHFSVCKRSNPPVQVWQPLSAIALTEIGVGCPLRALPNFWWILSMIDISMFTIGGGSGGCGINVLSFHSM